MPVVFERTEGVREIRRRRRALSNRGRAFVDGAVQTVGDRVRAA